MERQDLIILMLVIVSKYEFCRGSNYCSNFCRPTSTNNCEILPVCNDVTATSSTIYIDSTGASRNGETKCFCLIYHHLDTNTTFFVSSHTNGGPGLEMSLDNKTFNNTDSDRMVLKSGIHIEFEQSGFTLQSKLCLGISTGSDGGNISVSCFPNNYIPSCTQKPTASMSTQYSSEHSQTATVNNINTTEHVTEDITVSKTIYIAGAISGTVVITLVVVVCIACYRHRKKRHQAISANDTSMFDESIYSMDIKPCYMYVDNNALFKKRDSEPQYTYVSESSSYDGGKGNDEYSYVNEPVSNKRFDNSKHNSEYNHLHEVREKVFIGNIYNSCSH